jgi:hypothetical protein
MFLYKAFGLSIASELTLPELPMLSNDYGNTDVIVEMVDNLPFYWSSITNEESGFIFKDNSILFRLPNVGIFQIMNGNRIRVTALKEASKDRLRLYILGTCMGAILMQRKILPLHGSALAIDGRAIAIVGESGAGKSTLASAFLEKGYPLLSDDVIPISFRNDQEPMIIPAYPQQKLWKESLQHLGKESQHFRPVVEREEKFAIPVLDQFYTKPISLEAIFELKILEDDDINITPIQSLHRLPTLFEHTYRNFLFYHTGLIEWHFNCTVKLAEKVQIYQITRPKVRFTAHELADLILAKLEKGVQKI